MARAFYPFVDNGEPQPPTPPQGSGPQDRPDSASVVRYPARIAVYDDAAAAPRVVIVDPTDVRSYLEEITSQVTALAHEQGGTIPFTVIREIVENLIHAYFIEPTISILDGGNTIRFSDQGPGIKEKERALEYGTSTATEEMKRYIRGVGSGLPYVQQYMEQKGGCLVIEDNLSQGTVVTISTKPQGHRNGAGAAEIAAQGERPQAPAAPQQPATGYPAYGAGSYPQPYQAPYANWPAASYPAPGYPQQPWAAYQQQSPYPPAGGAPYGQAAYPAQVPSQAVYPPQQQGYPATAANPSMAGSQGRAGQTPSADAARVAIGQSTNAEHRLDAPTQQQPNPFPWISVTERGHAALEYLRSHETVGPSDLQRAYGGSQPTWTRELKLLEDDGLIKKDGQKRHLTNLGHAFIEQAL